MKAFATKVERFLKSEDGPTAVEYAVMVSLVIIAAIATIKGLGDGLNTTFGQITTGIGCHWSVAIPDSPFGDAITRRSRCTC